MIHKVIAIVADCDDTLAPDTTAQLLNAFGIDAKEFYRERVSRLVHEGWDPPIAYMHQILALVQEGPLEKLTETTLKEIGEGLDLYPGVPDVFSHLRAEIEQDREYGPRGIKLEYYVVSGGIEDLIAASPIGEAVDGIWGCNFAYDEDGRVIFPRCVVSFTEKTRFLFNIQKGLVGDKYKKQPYVVNVQMRPQDRRIPFRNMIYLGDGPSDIPCMSVLREEGYIVGILCEENASRAWALGYGRRANVTVPPDFRKGHLAYKLLKEILRRKADDIVRQIEYEEQGLIGLKY